MLDIQARQDDTVPSPDQRPMSRGTECHQYPYLSPHQSRTQEPTAWQQEPQRDRAACSAAAPISSMVRRWPQRFARAPAERRELTPENFTALMRELGA